MKESLTTIVEDQLQEHRKCTPRSEALFREAQEVLPGGTTRSLHYFEPYPLYIASGEGCTITDVDGNRRIDFFNNATSLILGHAHPAVVRAVGEQLGKGTAYHGPTVHATDLARLLRSRIPSVERVRFTNSGSEATLLAIQLARAFTGRGKIAKIEGGYHGSHDYANVSVHPPLEKAGDAKEPRSVPDAAGMGEEFLRSVVVVPYNDIDAAERIFWKHKDDLAGIIVEPLMGTAGVIGAKREFLQGLRQLTQQHGMVLIFDEVQTLRFGTGAAQEFYRVQPDLTTFGKIIGGGFPVGAVGGRKDIMELLDSTRGAKIPHGGTFNGNPITMAAGLATLSELTPETYRRLWDMGKDFRQRLRDQFAQYEVPAQITGEASFFAIHFTKTEVTDYRSAVTGIDKTLRRGLFIYLLNNGIFCASSLRGVLSTPMTKKEIDAFLIATENFVRRVK